MSETIIQVLHDLAENICDNFCKYQETTDEEGNCDWIRNGGKCPLDKIN